MIRLDGIFKLLMIVYISFVGKEKRNTKFPCKNFLDPSFDPYFNGWCFSGGFTVTHIPLLTGYHSSLGWDP